MLFSFIWGLILKLPLCLKFCNSNSCGIVARWKLYINIKLLVITAILNISKRLGIDATVIVWTSLYSKQNNSGFCFCLKKTKSQLLLYTMIGCIYPISICFCWLKALGLRTIAVVAITPWFLMLFCSLYIVCELNWRELSWFRCT